VCVHDRTLQAPLCYFRLQKQQPQQIIQLNGSEALKSYLKEQLEAKEQILNRDIEKQREPHTIIDDFRKTQHLLSQHAQRVITCNLEDFKTVKCPETPPSISIFQFREMVGFRTHALLLLSGFV
jgi:hypothetical protein